MNSQSFINYGIGPGPKPEVHLPAMLYTPSQRVSVIAKHAQIQSEMKVSVSATNKKKWGHLTGDKYYMPRDYVGVL